MTRGTRHTLVTQLSDCRQVVEVGVGRRLEVARALAARGVEVTATDVRERSTPPPVRFVRDDVTDPDPVVYAEADAVYARRCPPELQAPVRSVARTVDCPFLFTTLGGDPAVVDARPVTAADGAVFVAGGPTPQQGGV